MPRIKCPAPGAAPVPPFIAAPWPPCPEPRRAGGRGLTTAVLICGLVRPADVGSPPELDGSSANSGRHKWPQVTAVDDCLGVGFFDMDKGDGTSAIVLAADLHIRKRKWAFEARNIVKVDDIASVFAPQGGSFGTCVSARTTVCGCKGDWFLPRGKSINRLCDEHSIARCHFSRESVGRMVPTSNNVPEVLFSGFQNNHVAPVHLSNLT